MQEKILNEILATVKDLQKEIGELKKGRKEDREYLINYIEKGRKEDREYFNKLRKEDREYLINYIEEGRKEDREYLINYIEKGRKEDREYFNKLRKEDREYFNKLRKEDRSAVLDIFARMEKAIDKELKTNKQKLKINENKISNIEIGIEQLFEAVKVG